MDALHRNSLFRHRLAVHEAGHALVHCVFGDPCARIKLFTGPDGMLTGGQAWHGLGCGKVESVQQAFQYAVALWAGHAAEDLLLSQELLDLTGTMYTGEESDTAGILKATGFYIARTGGTKEEWERHTALRAYKILEDHLPILKATANRVLDGFETDRLTGPLSKIKTDMTYAAYPPELKTQGFFWKVLSHTPVSQTV